MALLDDPENTIRLMETVTKWSVALAVAQVRRGAHAIKISSPFAGMGFLPPEMYEEFIIPFEKQIAEAVKAEGSFVYTHTCGAIGDRLDLLGASTRLHWEMSTWRKLSRSSTARFSSKATSTQ